MHKTLYTNKQKEKADRNKQTEQPISNSSLSHTLLKANTTHQTSFWDGFRTNVLE